MKKIIFLILFASLGWQYAQAQTIFTYGGLKFNVTTGTTVEVANQNGAATGIITIPSEVTNAGTVYSVTSIGIDAFRYCTNLTSVTIPDSVTSIGNYAFNQCTNLISVTIPDKVASIGTYAFSNCSKLTSVTIPNLVTSIGEWTFSNCSALSSVTISNSLISIDNGAFAYCSSLTSITIPNKVTGIGNGAFYGCAKLTSITIPNSVTSIGSSAFINCSALTSVTIPNLVTIIDDQTFNNCTSLTTVTIPNSVKSFGNGAFYRCTKLTSITIPNSVTSIGSSAFYNCSALTSITIPDLVTIIDEQTFNICTSLTTVTIPNSVTTIGNSAFSGCAKLTSLTIPSAVRSFGNSAFSGCATLTSVTFPSTVTNISDNAFSGCTKLTSVISNIATPLVINANVFQGVKQSSCSLTVPDTSIAAYRAANVWKSFNPIVCIITENTTTVSACESYTWANNNQTYTVSGVYTGLTADCVTQKLDLTITNPLANFSNDRINYVVTSSSTVSVGNNTVATGVVVIPTTVTTACGTYAVTSIGNNAFDGCSGLTSVTIPESVTSIGVSAFGGCTGLSSVICNVNTPIIIDASVFGGLNQATCSLIVPEASVAAYRAANVWKDFAPINASLLNPSFTTMSLQLYPIPAKTILNIQSSNNRILDNITITDLTGKIVLTQTTHTNQVAVGRLSRGMYILQAVSGDTKFVSKFIKE